VVQDIFLKQYEKEALTKSFLIFFISLEILNIIIFSFYYKEQKRVLLNEIFSQIKEYNYTFENKNIAMDIVDISNNKEKYKLYIAQNEIFAYFDLLDSQDTLLKLIYNFDDYEQKLNEIYVRVILIFLTVTFVLFFYSIFYSFYALKPYKSAIEMLERFLKDIIHDLNTPISSILINTSILKTMHNMDAIKRIEYSSKTISNLYKNLELYLQNSKFAISNINITDIIIQRVNYFEKLYPDIEFIIDKKSFEQNTNEIAITRILDNIISNACKYNKKNGFVKIDFYENSIIIKDSGYGIKNPKKAFDRFYKESERGIGIGLNIVQKLSKEMNINIKLDSTVDIGTTFILNFKETNS
jgi:two-component system OmpR family sensor kinase